MFAILLAAGKGTRFGPLTQKIPKPMLPVNGKPLLEHTLLLLKNGGIDDLYINLHHLPEAIVDYFGDGSKWGIHISYSYEETLLGTAGAVKKILSSRNLKDESQSFWVVYGDNYFDCDLRPLIKLHQEKKGAGVIGLHPREDVFSSGIVDLDDDGRICRFLEKPRPEEVFSHLVSAGIFLLNSRVLQFIPDGFSDFSHDIFPRVIESGQRLYGHVFEGLVIGIDTPDAYHKLQETFTN